MSDVLSSTIEYSIGGGRPRTMHLLRAQIRPAGVAPDRPDLEGRGGWAEHSSRVQAGCDYYGPADLLAMVEQPSSLDHNGPD